MRLDRRVRIQDCADTNRIADQKELELQIVSVEGLDHKRRVVGLDHVLHQGREQMYRPLVLYCADKYQTRLEPDREVTVIVGNRLMTDHRFERRTYPYPQISRGQCSSGHHRPSLVYLARHQWRPRIRPHGRGPPAAAQTTPPPRAPGIASSTAARTVSTECPSITPYSTATLGVR